MISVVKKANNQTHLQISLFYLFFTRQNYSDILISIQMEVPPGDVFVHAGDFTRCGSVQEVKTSDFSFLSSGSVQEVKVFA